MKKKYLMLLLCLPLLITGCKKIPQLQDGKQVIVEVNGKQFTAEEFFDELKEISGTGVLINLVNNYITEQELSDEMKEDAKEQAQSHYDALYASYGSQWNDFLRYYNYTSGDAFLAYLQDSYMQSAAVEQYVRNDVITDEEIQTYYDENIYGEITVRHILIKPDVDDDMTDEEVEEAETAALEKAKELITQIQNSQNLEEDFTSLAKENSDDIGTAELGGLLENITNESGLVIEFWEAANDLEVGEFTKEPVETEFGYHIIYKVSQKEKPSLDSVKDKVLDGLVSELLSATDAESIYWAGLREKYNMVIYDDIIKDSYDATMKSLQKN